MNESRTGIDWEEVRARLRNSQLALERALTADPERIAAIYRERSLQLAGRRTQAEMLPDGVRVLTFFLDRDCYGLEFADVVELLPYARCTPVPGAPAALLGVINVHGEIRSVVDLGRLLDAPAHAGDVDGYVILLRKGNDTAALRVDRLDKIQVVARGDIAVPEGEETGVLLRYLRGFTAERLKLLDTEAILAHPLFQGSP